MAKFNNDLKGMLPFIGNTFNGDVSDIVKTLETHCAKENSIGYR